MLFIIQSLIGFLLLFVIEFTIFGKLTTFIIVISYLVMSGVFIVKDFRTYENNKTNFYNYLVWYVVVMITVVLQLTIGDKIKLP
ncbi:hypothetical protein GCM10008018_44750 [Paenibacillus marchantiophytorum]|uniref:Uncharacterized protein n=1 Tax=Paenibacillus marchantiophytorum TaxID=1619310 RepID=A0ABQ1EYP7_9BACL|nr:hypothetical protein GCM10008018_44750 [Paenibacillus marchantiophytorum]